MPRQTRKKQSVPRERVNGKSPLLGNDEHIELRGVRVHNLKNIDVRLPLGRLTVITGVSGSGKSSLAFDTLYAEGQRRYVESLSSYARQFLERIDKPDVDEVLGICPALAIRQKAGGRNPRSLVATVTEIYDFIRLLFARVGTTFCHSCGSKVEKEHAEHVARKLLQLPSGARLYVLFPLRSLLGPSEGGPPGEEGKETIDRRRRRKTAAQPVLDQTLVGRLRKEGYARLLIDFQVTDLNHPALPYGRTIDDDWYVVVDRLSLSQEIHSRLIDSLETVLREGNGRGAVFLLKEPGTVAETWAETLKSKSLQIRPEGILYKFSEQYECSACGIVYQTPEPRLFSFNSPFGACPVCQGFGNTMSWDADLIIPDGNKCLEEGAIDPWTKPAYTHFQDELLLFAESAGIPTDVPFHQLSAEHRRWILDGSEAEGYGGIKGFFEYLESKKYKMHVRVFLSRYRGYLRCQACGGSRLRPEALDVYLGGKRIAEILSLNIRAARQFFQHLTLSAMEREISERLLEEIRQRLDLLIQVGLDYLHLDRLTSTLSGGESQRIQLSTAIGSSLVGALYVLDEPSIGLHPRDSERLIHILYRLRDIGNTVLVVEHDAQIMRAADYLIDLGPGAGEWGGEVLFQGPPDRLPLQGDSLTAKYLQRKKSIPVPKRRPYSADRQITVLGAKAHNLKDIDVCLPLGLLVCISGVSGSGKSTLAHEVLFAGMKRLRGQWKEETGECRGIQGSQLVREVVLVDQSPIGRTSRSNPATYVKAFDEIRTLFASLPEARQRHLLPKHFSFNVEGGRCERCQGTGVEVITMQFLADVEVTCEDCGGKRFRPEVLEVRYKGRNLAEVLDLTVTEALTFFLGEPRILARLRSLEEVGLGYLRLGQSTSTLSGGEAQRLKLCGFLAEGETEGILYIFDEPTTGLHFEDIGVLLKAFDRLLQSGASLLVIEHNLDVLKSADWIIDLGPEGGDEGGFLVGQGTPEAICRIEESHTGRFLKRHMEL